MQFAVIQSLLGILLILFSLTMLPPLIISIITKDGVTFPFLISLTLTLGIGFLLWLPVRKVKRELKSRDGFIVVVLFWLSLSLSGSIPLILADTPDLSVSDAIFESVSGLTTTGATIMTGIDMLPKSILFYRQELQWQRDTYLSAHVIDPVRQSGIFSASAAGPGGGAAAGACVTARR